MTLIPSILKAGLIAVSLFSLTACQSQTQATETKEQQDIKQLVQVEQRDLPPAEFRNLVDRTPGHVLLDVRTETERLQTGFMIDSRHLDFYRPDFEEQLSKLDKEKTYFVYCRSGQRSGKTVDQLRAKGIKAYNLKGGFIAWKEVFPF